MPGQSESYRWGVTAKGVDLLAALDHFLQQAPTWVGKDR